MVAPEAVLVDREHVAIAGRSEHYARSSAVEKSERMSPLSLFWETADGRWFRLHGEYPWHHERALRVLGCEDRHRAVKQAVATWQAEDLENALADRGALGYAVRTEQEWSGHPQGQAVAALPLLETKVGSGLGRDLGAGRVATGLRVLDLTRVLAGPIATRTFAAWGAEVLRIDCPRLPELPVHAMDTMSGKRSATLDLADPGDRTRFEGLLREADLLVHGYRPGALEQFGLGAGELAARHPHLSVVTLCAWGPTGPWSSRRGFDSLVQCATGIAQGEGDAVRPGWLPAQVLDHATGYLAAAAGFMALASTQLDGHPRTVQVSLAQTARWLTSAGHSALQEPRPVDVDAYRVALPGARARVEVIKPPGQLADLAPSWNFTTDFGSGEPTFTGLDVR
jgi:crotonobetainyl-CoA:carnitine CoA-transferase CaiB-like acyl-CoA transferase